jgi:hypothetical protein
MLNLAKFNVGDLVVQDFTDPKDPSKRIARRGIIKEVNPTTILVKWTREPRLADIKDIPITTMMFRKLIMSGSIKHYPSKK